MKTNYKQLRVWQESMDLVVIIYELVKRLPKSELYGLGDQLRRAVISIPSNIAEGQRRNSYKDFVRFINISLGSMSEVETQLLLVERLYGLEVSGVLEKTNKITRMLFKLRSDLKRRTVNDER